MPIASYKPSTEPDVKPQKPQVEPKNYKSVIYDDNNVPLTSLIAFVEGAPWTVKSFYAQVVSQHNDLREIDTGESGSNQSYEKFNNLEIRVEQALTASYDTATGISKVEGSGAIYPFMKVNVGDMFVTDTADNQRTLLKLTSVERKTFNRDSAWSIRYEVMGYIDEQPTVKELYDNVELKTIREYYFDKARLIEGLQPIIKSEEYHNVTNLKTVYQDIARYYFENFYTARYSTLPIPGQETSMYDSGLINYLLKITPVNAAAQLHFVKKVPTDNDPYLSQPDFWKMLLEKEYSMLGRCNDSFGLVAKNAFPSLSFMNGIRYSNMNYVVYPMNPDRTLSVMGAAPPKPIAMQEVIQTESFKGLTYTDIDNTYITPTKTYKIIHEVLVDDKYVLSSNFYNNTSEQSLLEILTKDYLNHQFIDLKMLYACCNVFKKWKRLEQFYYGPILMTLLLESYRAQYT